MRTSLAAVLWCALAALSLRAEPPKSARAVANEPAAPRGRLMLMGGHIRDNNSTIWAEMVRLAGGAGRTVAVFPTASNHPQRTGENTVRQMTDLGLKAFYVPAATELKTIDYRQVARDREWAERVRAADAVFLGGGEQARYRKVLVEPEGGNTPLLEAIWHVYRKGGLVVGTSAGASAMGRCMFVEADFVLPVLVGGVQLGEQVDYGLGFAPADCFVDQHFLARGRFARAIVAMQTLGFSYGLGIDEDTALVIEQADEARVVGYRGVLLLDAAQARRRQGEKRFSVENLRLCYLSHGDRVALDTRQAAVSAEKMAGDKIDPRSPTFKPYFQHHQFYNDILGNTTVLEVMYKLVDSPHEEALGIAFDGRAARAGPTPGFEFRFYRGRDTVAWQLPAGTIDPHTVLNVYLDIRPIEVRGPLY